MDIFKFEILQEDDEVISIDPPKIHIKSKDGSHLVYTLRFDDKNEFTDFDVFVVSKGAGSIDFSKDANPEDLFNLWDELNG